jgi:phospholipase/carboxylesterase
MMGTPTGARPALSLTHRVVPARQPGGGRPPGLLLLHGRGADELDLLGLAGALDPRLTLISARAPFPLGPGYHWYDLIDIGVPEPRSYAAARARLEAFAGEIVDAYRIDPARLYVLGFSQGAVMAGGLVLALPARLAGAVLLSGYLPLDQGVPGDAAGLRGLPVFVGHGVDDPVIAVRYGRQTRDALLRLGAALTYCEYPLPHAIGAEELADIAAWLAARLDEPAARESAPDDQ